MRRTHFGENTARFGYIQVSLQLSIDGASDGAIHTDFERGFIRAETIAYDDYVKGGGEAGAREIGKLRLEGKEYEVADGDVMHFRFAT
jgi:hypothetical protein